MITLKVDKLNREISQKLYDEIIESVDIHLLECTCKRHNMVVHGYYSRNIKTHNGNVELVILRVRCKECGKTHAVLISFIVPYQSIEMSVQIEIITDKDIEKIRQLVPNKMILVLNKKDALPKSVKEEKLIQYFKNMNLNFEEIIVVSVNKNYNIDYLLKRIKYYQTSKNVYAIGHTNAGKSSLINKLIKNYSDKTQEITMSPLPSTTLNTIKIEINDYLTLIDTPGLIDSGSILNIVDTKMVKKISPVKEIKPKTYQIRKNQSIIIEDFLRIDYVDGVRNSFTLYVSNDLRVKRLLNSNNKDDLKDLNKTNYQVKYGEDLVVSGLGFIKMVDKCEIDVYIDQNVDTFLRKNLI